MKRKEYDFELKLQCVKSVIEDGQAISLVARENKLPRSSLLVYWINSYINEGENGLIRKTKNKYYSAELKKKAVLDYLESNDGYSEVAFRHGIRGQNVLARWVAMYNKGEELTASRKGPKPGGQNMKKKKPVKLQKINDEMTDQQKLKAYEKRLKQLEEINEDQRLEILFLKKLEELERRNRRL